MTDRPDPREAKTDPIGTAPPESASAPAPMPAMPPPAALPSTGPNPSFAEDTMRDLLATAKRLEQHYETLLDPTGLLTQQTAHIAGLIDTNYSLIHREVVGIRGTLDALAPRVTATEGGLEALRNEFTAMKLRMVQIEAALGIREGSHAAAEPTPPTR